MEYFYAGIDGGGTNCRLAVGTEDARIAHQIQGSASNMYSIGFERAFASMTDLLDKACRTGQLDLSACRGLCVGSAGLGRTNEKKLFTDAFRKKYPHLPVYICSDGEILLAGSLAGKSGICLIAGTGSVCYGTDGKRLLRSGGFGWRLGDEGSGWYIANSALARTLKSKEDRDLPTSLEKAIIPFFQLNNLEEIISYANANEREKAQIAAFAPQVTAFAAQGDQLAADILTEAGTDLGKLVLSVYNRLQAKEELLLSCSGAVVKKDPFVQESFHAFLKAEKLPLHMLDQPLGGPLEGALLLARERTRI
jgi:N-acetylglucosamine kinase-like BadF-type ATPase